MAVFPWLLSVIVLPSIHALKCVDVVPDDIHQVPVELGKEFTATCLLYHKHLRADNIVWSYGDGTGPVILPREYYRKINESAGTITIKVTKDMKGFLKCSVENHETLIHNDCASYSYGILLHKGYPPEKPTDLTCQAVQEGPKMSNNISCHWNPGRNPIMETTYTLFFEAGGVVTEAQSTDSSGTVSLSIFPYLMEVNFWVKAENRLGTVSSDVVKTETECLIKTNPPDNVRITSEEVFPESLLVEWTAPIQQYYVKLTYNIRFCEKGSDTWSEVPLEDTKDYLDSFRLQALKPYTEYVVQVRCKSKKDQAYWSDWSRNATVRTAEDLPSSKPDIWMQASDEGALKIIRLLLKKPLLSNGMMLQYEINVFEDGESRQSFHFPFQNGNEKPFQVVQFSVKRQSVAYVEVSGRNSVGNSPTADLAVPLAQELPSMEDVVVYAQDDRLWVEWSAPKVVGPPVEYVLEWVSLVDEDMDWQREPRNATKASIKGNLRPYVPYNVTVVPIYHRALKEKSSKLLHLTLPGKPITVTTYLKEGVPAVVPSVTVARSWKNGAELRWKEIPLVKQRGFITNYTIVYESDGSGVKVETVPPYVYTFTLKNLTKDTNYKLYIKASTVAGSRSSTAFYMITPKYDPGEIEMIVVSVCFGFLFLAILAIRLCFKNKETLKKKFWPQVPDPYNSTVAKWSPDLSAKAGTPKEAAIGNLSVVEVDVFDQKSLCDEDKTSLPALKKDKYMSEEHSSGIGGSSCMSSPRQSVSDSDEADSGQTTASTVQYSSVVGYKGQTPAGGGSSATATSSSSSSSSSSSLPAAAAAGTSGGTIASAHTFARSESTQPLLECEEQQEGSSHHHHPGRGSLFRRHHGFGDCDSSGSSGVGESSMHRLHPSEQDEQDSSSLEFCPAEDAVIEQPADLHFGRPPYMPQQSGYRPQ